MTISERVVAFLLEDEDNALLRDVARAGLVSAWLSQIGDNDIQDIRFGVEISTGEQYFMEENAREILKRDLTDEDWAQLTEDIRHVENNCTHILDANGIAFRDEGHSDSALVGSAWMRSVPDQMTGDHWVPQQNALRMVLAGVNEPLMTSSGSIHSFDRHQQLFKNVSDVGQAVLDVRIAFFDTAALQLDMWEELLQQRPQLWPVRQKPAIGEKKMLDFNQVVGAPREKSGIFMSRVDGTPIFSARCPGCKHIHGNFRTWEEASGNRMCKKCVSDFVDITMKAHQTGNYKPLLKKERK